MKNKPKVRKAWGINWTKIKEGDDYSGYIEPVHAVANQLNILAPVGIAIHEVAAVN